MSSAPKVTLQIVAYFYDRHDDCNDRKYVYSTGHILVPEAYLSGEILFDILAQIYNKY